MSQPGHRSAHPRPAISPQAVARLPRWPLWLTCLAYIVPGFVGRDPWTGDAVTFGAIWQLARGWCGWMQPGVYGHPVPGGWLPYWLGAASVRAFGGVLGDVLASRLPFALMLGATLALTWAAAYRFALCDAAQPVRPAFAEAVEPRAYARAVADGALLSLLACLGLLVHGHQQNVELMQLPGDAALLYGLSRLPRSPLPAAIALLGGLLVLATSGAPWVALFAALTVGALLVTPAAAGPRRLPAAAVAAGAAVAAAVLLHQHGASTASVPDLATLGDFAGNFVWFVWPAWPLAAWGVWRWRESLGEWHVLAPLALAALAIVTAVLTAVNPIPLLLALPSLAVLASFALPVMRRGSLAALDWFALSLFSLLALVVWVLWLSMLTGIPAQPAANIARLAPGFVARFQLFPTAVALAATLGWGAVVTWRAGRHRHPLWKGMVLSAGGVTLVWVLVGTLWLPVLDYASSYRGIGTEIAAALRAGGAPENARIGGLHLTEAQRAMLGYWSGARLDTPVRDAEFVLVLHRRGESDDRRADLPPHRIWSGRRPGESGERFDLFRRGGQR